MEGNYNNWHMLIRYKGSLQNPSSNDIKEMSICNIEKFTQDQMNKYQFLLEQLLYMAGKPQQEKTMQIISLPITKSRP